ncbi:hypothetical protein OGATHE_006200 [Ogataea polymorpha]|uniref:Uncharacterized protein n=1 Tax=Ogataea polymorpha TaxID=460523 RepID=A0A9P8SZ99_9ASCO|nr:hypothetical protein OGATHE_006200 [Ogataea polymorpha]
MSTSEMASICTNVSSESELFLSSTLIASCNFAAKNSALEDALLCIVDVDETVLALRKFIKLDAAPAFLGRSPSSITGPSITDRFDLRCVKNESDAPFPVVALAVFEMSAELTWRDTPADAELPIVPLATTLDPDPDPVVAEEVPEPTVLTIFETGNMCTRFGFCACSCTTATIDDLVFLFFASCFAARPLFSRVKLRRPSVSDPPDPTRWAFVNAGLDGTSVCLGRDMVSVVSTMQQF